MIGIRPRFERNKPLALQNMKGGGNMGSLRPEHDREEFMGDQQVVAACAVVHHEQLACEASLDKIFTICKRR